MSEFEEYLKELKDLHFDNWKLRSISENLSRLDLTKLDLLLKQFYFDTSRISLLELLQPELDDQLLLKAVAEFTHDEYKLKAIELLFPKVKKISFMVYKILARNIKFEMKRLRLFKLWTVNFSQQELIELLALAESDKGVLAYLEHLRTQPNFNIDDRLLGKFFNSDENYFKVAQDAEFAPSNSPLEFMIFGQKIPGMFLPIGRMIQMVELPWKVYLTRSLDSIKVVCANLDDSSRVEQSYKDDGVIKISLDDSSSGRTLSLSDPS